VLGEHLGQGLAVAWSATVAVVIPRSRAAPPWLGWTGLAASLLYLLNQGDQLSTVFSSSTSYRRRWSERSRLETMAGPPMPLDRSRRP
jgi:hypothetical protein